MSQFDIMYAELVRRIEREGVYTHGQKVRPKYITDGAPAHTKAIFFHTMTFYPHEVPVLTIKNNFPVTANNERHWIWNEKSNKIDDLRRLNGTEKTVWNEWMLPDGTIGKAYGYQLGKKVMELKEKQVDQVDYVLHELRNNPSSRRIMTELWNIDDLTDMSLPPCVHHTQWDTFDGTLNLLVKARSSDVGLGLPFNVYQYAVLHRMVARHADLPLGKMYFVLGNVHIYDRHLETLREVIANEPLPAPDLYIEPTVKNFYDFTNKDVRLIDYKHQGNYNFEVAE